MMHSLALLMNVLSDDYFPYLGSVLTERGARFLSFVVVVVVDTKSV